jgi:hypothetical protein
MIGEIPPGSVGVGDSNRDSNCPGRRGPGRGSPGQKFEAADVDGQRRTRRPGLTSEGSHGRRGAAQGTLDGLLCASSKVMARTTAWVAACNGDQRRSLPVAAARSGGAATSIELRSSVGTRMTPPLR